MSAALVGQPVIDAYWWRPLSGPIAQIALDAWHFRPRVHQRGSRSELGWSLRNFGDELVPLLLNALVPGRLVRHRDLRSARVALIGSILERVIRNGTDSIIVGGCGLQAPSMSVGDLAGLGRVDIVAVRGELTRRALGLSGRVGLGDPALALATMFTRSETVSGITLVLHFGITRKPRWRADVAELSARLGARVVFTSDPAVEVVETIGRSSLVVSTSLHGVIVADALGVPAVPATLDRQRADFRFSDYHSGLGVDAAGLLVSLGGLSPASAMDYASDRARRLGSAPAERSHEVQEWLTNIAARL